MVLAPALRISLATVAEAASAARDPWWVIGSAAVALHGADVPDVQDVDLLMSTKDAEETLWRLGEPRQPKGTNTRFRSAVFGVWSASPLPIEIMGGFSVATKGGWAPVWPVTREPVIVDRHRLFVPDARELVQLLLTFGREKDLERARLLGRRADGGS